MKISILFISIFKTILVTIIKIIDNVKFIKLISKNDNLTF